MIEAAFQWLKQHTSPTIKEVGGRQFSDSEFTEIKPEPDPLKPTLGVATLSGLVDVIKNGLDITPAKTIVHVVNHGKVEVLDRDGDKWGRRQTIAFAAMPEYKGFQFNVYLPHEDFCIGLQQHFVPAQDPDNDFLYVARVSATVTASAVTISENDGISQQVELKRSVKSGLKDFADLRRIVKLSPYRTFVEADQPESPFIFRAQDQGEGKIPKLALFECDGGRWKTVAMKSIADYLERANIGVTVIC